MKKRAGFKSMGLKRTGLVLCIVISLFVMVGSSIWEGAAGVATGGDFPGNGLYIATNSFPLNTVVYVTNLENGQTTRVVTSAPLEAAPGLLALLSRDAAEAIGLPYRTLGRIRMSQPPDNVAFSRFGQRRPNPDPTAFTALQNLHLFTEAAGTNPGGDIIIDLPIADEVQVIRIPENPLLEALPEPEELVLEMIQEQENYIVPEPELVQAPIPVETLAAEQEIAEYDFEEQDLRDAIGEAGNQQRFHRDALSVMQGFFPEPSYTIVENFFADEPEIAEQQPEEPAPEEAPIAVTEPAFPAPDYILTFVPADPRPPSDVQVTPNPAYFIPGIAPVPVAQALDQMRQDLIDPYMIIDPIREPPLPVAEYVEPEPIEVAQAEPVEEPIVQVQEEPLQEQIVQVQEEPVLQEPIVQVQEEPVQEQIVQVQEEPVQEPIAQVQEEPLFPVPMISYLQAGRHYLQLAAYRNVEYVHHELSRLDRIDSGLARELVIMRYENHPEYDIIYQILIGPLSFGESGALLHRFRNSTHRGAFIRTGS